MEHLHNILVQSFRSLTWLRKSEFSEFDLIHTAELLELHAQAMRKYAMGDPLGAETDLKTAFTLALRYEEQLLAFRDGAILK